MTLDTPPSFLVQGSTTKKMTPQYIKAPSERIQGQEHSWKGAKQEVALFLPPHLSLTGLLVSLCWQEFAQTQK